LAAFYHGLQGRLSVVQLVRERFSTPVWVRFLDDMAAYTRGELGDDVMRFVYDRSDDLHLISPDGLMARRLARWEEATTEPPPVPATPVPPALTDVPEDAPDASEEADPDADPPYAELVRGRKLITIGPCDQRGMSAWAKSHAITLDHRFSNSSTAKMIEKCPEGSIIVVASTAPPTDLTHKAIIARHPDIVQLNVRWCGLSQIDRQLSRPEALRKLEQTAS
jgi:hypothetical protein